MINIPITNNKDNKIYPSFYHNGILDLGFYKNGNIEIEFETNKDIDNSVYLRLGIFDIKKYNELFADKNVIQNNIEISINDNNNIKITGNVDKKRNLFIPVNYHYTWKDIKSNKSVNRILNTFISVELNEGNNDIELSTKPVLYEFAWFVSIGTTIFMIIVYFLRKKYDIRNVKLIVNEVWILGIIIFIGMFYKVYISSIIKTLVDIVQRIIGC